MTTSERGRPPVVHTREDLREAHAELEGPVAVVMTMGALHEGHAALVRQAHEHGGSVIVTIFVNPIQFNDPFDLEKYPRTQDADLDLLAGIGADVVFAPRVEEMYPDGQPSVRIKAGPMGDVLEGAHRPGHFDGMLTVVAKLLHLTRPDIALFGQKDAQQLALIRRMCLDLNFPVDVVAVPTVREPDGLALSSRNVHLTAQDRGVALVLWRALQAGQAALADGTEAVRAAAHAVLGAEPRAQVDYLALVDPRTLEEVPHGFHGETVLAVAARVGGTRLIDNVPLRFGGPGPEAAR